MTVNNLNDLLNTAAEAFRHQDVDTLFSLQDTVRDWLQTEDEKQAQLNLLNVVLEALDVDYDDFDGCPS